MCCCQSTTVLKVGLIKVLYFIYCILLPLDKCIRTQSFWKWIWQQMKPLPSLSSSFNYFSTWCLSTLPVQEKSAQISSMNCTKSISCGEQHVIETTTDRKWVLPHFLYTKVTLLATWCIHFFRTATRPQLLFVVAIRSRTIRRKQTQTPQ